MALASLDIWYMSCSKYKGEGESTLLEVFISFLICRRKKLKYGIGSACIGGGQGIALLLESV